jgi:hypothetical protein
MSHSLTAHRDERLLLGITFAKDLPSTATISSVDELVILDHATGADVTDQFRDPPGGGAAVDPTISGLVVSFWKEEAATATDQLPGRYRVRCRVIVDTGEEPIALDDFDKLIHLRIVGD